MTPLTLAHLLQWPANIPTDAQLIRMELYLDQVLKETRRLFKLASAKNEVKRMRIFIASAAPPWQQKAAGECGRAGSIFSPSIHAHQSSLAPHLMLTRPRTFLLL